MTADYDQRLYDDVKKAIEKLDEEVPTVVKAERLEEALFAAIDATICTQYAHDCNCREDAVRAVLEVLLPDSTKRSEG